MSNQGEFAFENVDPDFDARGRAPKSKKKKATTAPLVGVWDNCNAGNHRLCAVGPIVVNGTLEVISCGCACHQKQCGA